MPFVPLAASTWRLDVALAPAGVVIVADTLVNVALVDVLAARMCHHPSWYCSNLKRWGALPIIRFTQAETVY